ncbi:hypothetical protein BL250_16140 [Erwinia sp. OLTSP20]|uniref:T6SS phospholipase effector Tle1-like catalytic domain-containing protein n=1 Tax=unclassified Erwinia TaxID=2622719 RepID=UPI000C17BB29|nr:MULTISPECIES: DUF2235 domain-containing protein [unclassified Erwinia]PIJ48125.1 hypothetical protein BV501_18170 [Erwinia sp. OAMSP11]PIJ73637.1 hypothetical protein BK416_05860 [Erwinia sp. OLSSP12]PIJ80846.1 hypothetical protein BLD49_17010 [Erwinia sp. OLMDSP33]PIJ82994.1 hypothetical protein BLD47_05355 [Erwinia sp. OLCASP19]PIJ85593.1 hypothetical protein BLD46_05385 [Erwinia sp. OLMTSP26]
MINSVRNNEEEQSVNIRIGIFFDGTGLNANNLIKNKYADDYKYSNIYRLYKYYGDSTENTTRDATLKVYVEGVGTKDNEESQCIIAMGVDFGQFEGWGVFAKYENAVAGAAKQLADFLEDKKIECCQLNIEFDVFGFSRGAAIARHFTNKIAQHDRCFMEKINRAISPYNCFLQSSPSVNFLGLFDTVASVWSVGMWGVYDPHDYEGNTNHLEVNLPPNVARQVFQLTAMHECRYNFPLSSLEGYYPQLELAGCHSDIGGSYDICVEETSAITELVKYLPWEETVIKRLTEEMNLLRENEKWRVLMSNWFPVSNLVGSWADVTKIVRGELQYVALLVMFECAQRHGCKFNQDILQYEDKIEGELKPYYIDAMNNMMMALLGEEAKISQQLVDDITENYVHLSSTWYHDGIKEQPVDNHSHFIEFRKLRDDNYIEEKFNKAWPMRPEKNWERTVYFNNQPL